MGDTQFMQAAIALADESAQRGDHPFGAVLVHDGKVVLSAGNTVISAGDVTNHAETNLVRLAVQQYTPAFLAECTMYASTEPCPMCAGAIYWAGIGQVVYGCSADQLYALAGGEGLHLSCRDVLAAGDRAVMVNGPFLSELAVQSHVGYWQPSV